MVARAWQTSHSPYDSLGFHRSRRGSRLLREGPRSSLLSHKYRQYRWAGVSTMAQVEFRGALLTTSSALALILGIGAAQAGPPPAPCAVNNTFTGLPNSGAINCVSFNDGANHTGDV